MACLPIQKQVDEISNDEALQNDLKILPANYNFEIPKTIWRIRVTESRNVCLQFPEGLLLYSCVIADILRKYTECEIVIMGDVTYGACCVGHQTARAFGKYIYLIFIENSAIPKYQDKLVVVKFQLLNCFILYLVEIGDNDQGCDLMVHYGHSCLIPIQETQGIKMLYVFVSITINLGHFVDVLKTNFEKHKKLALVSTIQFIPSLQGIKKKLIDDGYNILLPQVKPLSPGEILGCTSPKLGEDVDAVIYLGDGRFHLESMMIQNPSVVAYQYDPYSKKFTHEEHDFNLMVIKRKESVEIAEKCHMFGLIQGSLGRQGNPKIVEDLEKKLQAAGKKFMRVLLSEITPQKLSCFTDIDCWVQVACPRLSIDWGASFEKPLLTPYELAAVLKYVSFRTDSYPMDYYANESLGPWTNNHETHREFRTKRNHIKVGTQT
ncbi:unnamed protein product [Litomosoides sigmodontis]|uniref:2-(3-amino-3-carboxypropyl)histidine synthase subunit 1 n=1 Tax=Litomosoides sigmodontis TaxID=42156 RepID=A0A3P6V5F4_LITSI|nr:unnamed protein product [Litomosoides sigmodontis]